MARVKVQGLPEFYTPDENLSSVHRVYAGKIESITKDDSPAEEPKQVKVLDAEEKETKKTTPKKRGRRKKK